MGLKFEAKSVDVEDFLEALEVENVVEATEHEFKFSCPFPGHQHGDQNPSAYMNKETSAWFCHGCHRKGNAVTFLAELENITIMLATRFLHERYGGIGSDPDAYSARVELEKLWEKKAREGLPTVDPKLPEDLIDRFLIDWVAVEGAVERPGWGDYILQRGFKPDTLAAWEIGYCEETNRVVIPVRDHEGDLVGFKGRSWKPDHNPKYLVLGSGEWERYHVGLNVFGLNRIEGHDLILVEGELNVVAMWQLGFRNVIAISGSNLTDRHAFLIRQYADRVTCFFDSNDAGDDATIEACEKLRDCMPVFVVPDHDFDAADLLTREDGEDSVRRLLQDAESEIAIRLKS